MPDFVDRTIAKRVPAERPHAELYPIPIPSRSQWFVGELELYWQVTPDRAVELEAALESVLTALDRKMKFEAGKSDRADPAFGDDARRLGALADRGHGAEGPLHRMSPVVPSSLWTGSTRPATTWMWLVTDRGIYEPIGAGRSWYKHMSDLPLIDTQIVVASGGRGVRSVPRADIEAIRTEWMRFSERSEQAFGGSCTT